MASITWIVKFQNGTQKDLKYVNGEDPKRNGTIKKGEKLYFEGTGFCFPWVDIAKGELKKAIKFYDASNNQFLFQVYQSWNRDRLEWMSVENGKDTDARSLSPDTSMGDRKSVIIENNFVPKAYNQYPNYTRHQSYYNNWMNMTHKEFYLSSPGDTGLNGIKVSDFLTDIWNQLKYPNGSNFLESGSALNGLLVESWHFDIASRVMDTVDGGVEHVAGHALPWIIRIACTGAKDYGGVMSHEFGHQYENALKTTATIGAHLKTTYRALRQVDFTARTPEPERYAEDFRYYFGVTGIRGNLNKEDDFYVTGGKVRHPDKVAGLKGFLRGSWPVYNYLRNRSYTNYQFNLEFAWFTNNRWEKFNPADGFFYWHDGKVWKRF